MFYLVSLKSWIVIESEICYNWFKQITTYSYYSGQPVGRHPQLRTGEHYQIMWLLLSLLMEHGSETE